MKASRVLAWGVVLIAVLVGLTEGFEAKQIIAERYPLLDKFIGMLSSACVVGLVYGLFIEEKNQQ